MIKQREYLGHLASFRDNLIYGTIFDNSISPLLNKSFSSQILIKHSVPKHRTKNFLAGSMSVNQEIVYLKAIELNFFNYYLFHILYPACCCDSSYPSGRNIISGAK